MRQSGSTTRRSRTAQLASYSSIALQFDDSDVLSPRVSPQRRLRAASYQPRVPTTLVLSGRMNVRCPSRGNSAIFSGFQHVWLIVCYKYDLEGNVIDTRDSHGVRRSAQYDSRGQMVSLAWMGSNLQSASVDVENNARGGASNEAM